MKDWLKNLALLVAGCPAEEDEQVVEQLIGFTVGFSGPANVSEERMHELVSKYYRAARRD